MGVLADHQIQKQVWIHPLPLNRKRVGKISYGIGSYGYDARIGYKFKVFSPVHCGVVDPKNFDEKSFVNIELEPLFDSDPVTQSILIPPNSFALGETLETFKIPRDILAICVGKSTYARCGIIVNVTPLEPEWEGKVTVEISNTSPLPAKIYAGEGIMQIIFIKADEVCRTSYADKKGIYQGQTELTLPKVRT